MNENGIAVRVEGLSKKYRIGLQERRHESLVGTVADWIRSPIRNFRDLRNLTHFDNDDGEDVIWALRDISFEVLRGEVIGIIGRNGAGKSTLLKILARVTAPTEGRAILNGRVGSLLEVGTGMHPELTGRENIYLSGTILGMTKVEIDRKFEEIVEFAELSRFIDTPVKRFSSGMNVRLGFAIAAHLEPEILLVDEVLAVGDMAFQKKCLGKISDVARAGRTVLFVSHNMAAIRQLCRKGICLNEGRLIAEGPIENTIERYMRENKEDKDDSERPPGTMQGKRKRSPWIQSIKIIDANGRETQQLGIQEPFEVIMHLALSDFQEPFILGLDVESDVMGPIARVRSDGTGTIFSRLKGKRDMIVSLKLAGLPLVPGNYSLKPWIVPSWDWKKWTDGPTVYIHLEAEGLTLAEKIIDRSAGLILLNGTWEIFHES